MQKVFAVNYKCCHSSFTEQQNLYGLRDFVKYRYTEFAVILVMHRIDFAVKKYSIIKTQISFFKPPAIFILDRKNL